MKRCACVDSDRVGEVSTRMSCSGGYTQRDGWTSCHWSNTQPDAALSAGREWECRTSGKPSIGWDTTLPRGVWVGHESVTVLGTPARVQHHTAGAVWRVGHARTDRTSIRPVLELEASQREHTHTNSAPTRFSKTILRILPETDMNMKRAVQS